MGKRKGVDQHVSSQGERWPSRGMGDDDAGLGEGKKRKRPGSAISNKRSLEKVQTEGGIFPSQRKGLKMRGGSAKPAK